MRKLISIAALAVAACSLGACASTGASSTNTTPGFVPPTIAQVQDSVCSLMSIGDTPADIDYAVDAVWGANNAEVSGALVANTVAAAASNC